MVPINTATKNRRALLQDGFIVGAMMLKQGTGDASIFYANHAPTTLDCIKYLSFVHFFCARKNGSTATAVEPFSATKSDLVILYWICVIRFVLSLFISATVPLWYTYYLVPITSSW